MFPLLCRSFLTWCDPMCPFLRWLPVFVRYYPRSLQCPGEFPQCFLLVVSFSLKELMDLRLKSKTWFDFLYMARDRGLVLFFCIWISSFLSTIYWWDCLFPSVYSCHFCWQRVHCRCVGLFLGSLFSFSGLCVCFYASTMPFWLL